MQMKFNKMIGISGVIVSLTAGVTALAYDYRGFDREGGYEEQRPMRRHVDRRQFELGVCVGQALAQQGIQLALPVQGQTNPPDASAQAALKTALNSCQSELNGASASPSPAPSSSPAPTSTDNPMPSPAPSASPAPSGVISTGP